MEELARQKVTDIHDLNAILRLTDFGKLGGKIWKILYELNSSPQLKARIVMPGKYIPVSYTHLDVYKRQDKVREGISYRVRHQHVPFTFSIILVCQHKTELLEFIESFAYLAYHVCIGTSRDKHLEQLMFRLAKGTHDIHRSRKNSLSHPPGCLFLIQVRTYIQVQFLRNSSIRCFAMQL